MNILFLTPDIPYPPTSGAALRNYGIIQGLVDAGHQVTLLTFVHDNSPDSSDKLYEICKTVHIVYSPSRSKVERLISLLTSPKSDVELRLASEEFEQKLIELLTHCTYDVLKFGGIELGGYLSTLKSHQKSAKIIYDATNAEAELQRVISKIDRSSIRRFPVGIYSMIQAQRIEKFEKWLCQTVDAVIAVSNEDKVHLQKYHGAPIFVMSNGIFVDNYSPRLESKRHQNQLVFTGKMDYRPNVDAIEWFVTSILPDIQMDIPDIYLTIVGRNPHPRIQSYAEQDNITITGWVESVQPYIHSATIFVVPLRMGSGTRLKILEAMASGCPVISTSIGAAGLHPDVKHAIKIADDDAEFGRIVVSLLKDTPLRQNLSKQAIQQVRQHYDWSALIPNLLAAYREIGLG